MEDVSKEIKRVRAQMEENEQVAILMRGLRGQNLSDSQFADENIQLRLVEVCLLRTFASFGFFVVIMYCLKFAFFDGLKFVAAFLFCKRRPKASSLASNN